MVVVAIPTRGHGPSSIELPALTIGAAETSPTLPDGGPLAGVGVLETVDVEAGGVADPVINVWSVEVAVMPVAGSVESTRK